MKQNINTYKQKEIGVTKNVKRKGRLPLSNGKGNEYKSKGKGLREFGSGGAPGGVGVVCQDIKKRTE